MYLYCFAVNVVFVTFCHFASITQSAAHAIKDGSAEIDFIKPTAPGTIQPPTNQFSIRVFS